MTLPAVEDWIWNDVGLIAPTPAERRAHETLKKYGVILDYRSELQKMSVPKTVQIDEAVLDKRIAEYHRKFSNASFDVRLDEWNKLFEEDSGGKDGEEAAPVSWADRLKADGHKEMTPPAPPKIPPPKTVPVEPTATGGTMDELEALTGLEAVKVQVRKAVNLVRVSRARAAEGMPKLDSTYHMVFTGNPGTGKTTVARIVGDIYREIGMLKTGHMVEADRAWPGGRVCRADGVEEEEVIQPAMDGILFIDEATR